MKKILALTLCLILALGIFAGCTPSAADDKTITIGASPTPHAEILEVVKAELAKDGWTLQITVFNDYVQPNTAVDDGELDANYFQHKPVPGGKTAVTLYKELERRGELSLVECRLLTGRTHQIRVSMAEIGCPLLGDGKYGKGEVNKRYHETRQALYSYKLMFDFPTDAGMLNYLKGREFSVEDVPFREKYFG